MRPLLGDLGATYDDHLRLIEKDFLLVLIELFSLGVTAEALRVNIGSKSATSLKRGRLTQNFRYKGSPLTNHYSSQKTKLNDLSFGEKIWIYLSFVLSQSTRLTDRQTDGQTGRIGNKMLSYRRETALQGAL